MLARQSVQRGRGIMDLIARIDALIDERHLLTHPFYTKWAAGTLPKESLQEYARQYYAFESSFPRLLSSLHTRSEDPQVRQTILENLWDEEHGATNHRELWLRFAEGIGVDRQDVMTAEWNPATTDLIETYWRAVREEPVAAGVAAVYAYERQVPQVAQSKIDGLREHFEVDDARTLEFFEVHGVLDVDHSDAEKRIVAEAGPDEEPRALAATRDALDAWWAFLDAVDPVLEPAGA
jgi:pyrroloquinoline-quinone synthase